MLKRSICRGVKLGNWERIASWRRAARKQGRHAHRHCTTPQVAITCMCARIADPLLTTTVASGSTWPPAVVHRHDRQVFATGTVWASQNEQPAELIPILTFLIENGSVPLWKYLMECELWYRSILFVTNFQIFKHLPLSFWFLRWRKPQ